MTKENGLITRRVAFASCGVGVAMILVGWIIWWRTPPQIGPDEEVIKNVDALFTAVTARDEKLLAQCEERLHAQKDAGQLPTAASDYLDGIIQKARDGGWESAAQRLYTFMKAQRREAGQDHPAKNKEKGLHHPGQKQAGPADDRRGQLK